MNEAKLQCKNRVRIINNNLKSTYKSKWFKIRIKHQFLQTSIRMTSALCVLNTESMPLTYDILNKELPGIFKSKCFNDGELPFHIEVKKTEIGHLFEHILLEYLCNEKIKSGAKSAKYCGETSWNWKKEKRGLFNIVVSSPISEKEIFYDSLLKSIQLLNKIIAYSRYQKEPLFYNKLSKGLAFLSGSPS